MGSRIGGKVLRLEGESALRSFAKKSREKKRISLQGAISPMIIHVYQERSVVSEETERRNAFAKQTWTIQYKKGDWRQRWFNDNHFQRTAANTVKGEKRDLPYIKDILRLGCLGLNDSEIICFTNADTCFAPDLTEKIKEALSKSEAAHGSRRDFEALQRPLNAKEVASGRLYPGTDIMVFRAGWWRKVHADYPDMLAGVEAVDRIFRELIKKHGGVEIKDGVYHEVHEQSWFINRLQWPANRHNRELAREWLRKNNLPLLELDFAEQPMLGNNNDEMVPNHRSPHQSRGSVRKTRSRAPHKSR